MSLSKFVLALGLVMPVFAGRIVFTFDSSNAASSLTLGGAAGSAAVGSSGVLSVINENTSTIFVITGGTFTFTTGSRTATPGAGDQSLNAGGSWTISGTITSGGQTATGTLVTGTFLSPSDLVNQSGRNTLNGAIDVNTINPILMTILGITGYVDNSDIVTLSRPGTYNSTTGAYANAGSPGSTNGSLAFQALSDVPEPSTFAMLAVAGLGTISLLTRRRVALKTESGKGE